MLLFSLFSSVCFLSPRQESNLDKMVGNLTSTSYFAQYRGHYHV